MSKYGAAKVKTTAEQRQKWKEHFGTKESAITLLVDDIEELIQQLHQATHCAVCDTLVQHPDGALHCKECVS